MRHARVRQVALLFVLAAGCSTDRLWGASGALQVSEGLDFGKVAVGRRETRTLTLTNTGAAPLAISSLALQAPAPPDFTLGTRPLQLAAGESVRMAVAFAPAELGRRGERLAIQTDSTRTPRAMVDLWGEGVLARAELDRTALDFGQVPIQTSQALTLALANTGADPADVAVGPLAGDDASFFTVSPKGALELAPGATSSITVRFSPMRLGAHLAALTVRQCPSCGATQVTLTGTGIAAALAANPPELAFGPVQPGQAVVRTTHVTNVGTEAVTVTGVFLGSGTSADNALENAPAPGLGLAPGEGFDVSVRYAPQALVSDTGTLRIAYVDASDPSTEVLVVSLAGQGGGPELEVVPQALAFPPSAVGMSVDKRLVLRSAGSEPLTVSALTFSGGVEMSLPNPPPLPLTLAPGQSRAVVVRYSPLLSGEASQTLAIASDDPTSPTLVPVTGSARDLAPCDVEVAPQQLDFGTVALGHEATLGFRVRNVGGDSCAVANVRASDATPPVFSVDPLSTRMIDPGASLVVPVQFKPDQAGNDTGEIDFDVSNPQSPHHGVVVLGRAVSGCLDFHPDALDFGTVGLACTPPTLSVEATNDCSAAVNVSGASIGTGASQAFSLDPSAAGARTLQPGETLSLQVTYAPTAAGDDSAPLFVATDLAPGPFDVPLTGHAAAVPEQTDVFPISATNKVDFLFVVDNSGSMSDKQNAIATNFPHFIQTAVADGSDFHLAVTTTGLTPYRGGWSDCPGGAYGGEDGRFFPVDNSRPRILTPTTPQLADVFAQNVKVGDCHWYEEGLEGMKRALSEPLISETDDPTTPPPNDGNAGFLRDDAALYVLVVSDSDDDQDGPKTIDPQSYVTFLDSLKPGRPDLVKVSGVIGLPSCDHIEGVGTRYMEVINATGGIVADICSPDWSGIFDRIGQQAFSPQSTFPLSHQSASASVTVTVDGDVVDSAAPDGSQVWHFDPTIGLHGAVVFDPAALPPPGSTVEITYAVPCPP